jgi:hypothetical protein
MKLKVLDTKRRMGAFACATALGGALLTGTIGITAAHAEGGCGAPASQPGAHTQTPQAVTYLYGRTIELRGNTYYTCAWGRISNGSPGDKVWVNRNGVDLSNYPYTGAGQAYVGSGNNQAYTPEAFNDNGTTMTACGQAWNRAEIACTQPY